MTTDYHNKILDYNVEGLRDAILCDATSNDMLARRYAVRFIMLDNFETFRQLRLFLCDQGVRLLQLDNILEDEPDGWISSDQLLNRVKQTVNTTLITPFSELVRFYTAEQFFGFMHDIALLEDLQHPEKRIYIPLIGLDNRIELFLREFGRIGESAPIWRCHTGKQSTKVYLMRGSPLEENSATMTVLHTAYEWLQYWKTSAPQETVICTSRSIRAYYQYSQPDNIFSFFPIKSTYQFLTEVCGYSFPFFDSNDEKEQWDRLATEVANISNTDFDFSSYVIHRFDMLNIDAVKLLSLWSNGDNFDRWLLLKYALSDSQFDNQPYLRQCMQTEGVLNADVLLITIATLVPLNTQGKPITQSIMQERARLMQSQHNRIRESVSMKQQEELRKTIDDIFQKGSTDIAKGLCTHTFDFEELLAARWFDQNEEDSFSRKDLQLLYPELHAYLEAPTTVTPVGCEWMTDYFISYRRNKLSDIYPDSIIDAINKYNNSAAEFYSWYHAVPRAHDLLAKEHAEHVYWIDGLGVEYMPYLQYLVGLQSMFVIEQCCYARADIPSTTSHNRYNLPRENIFRQLDEKGHDSKHYHKYNTLSEELLILRNVLTNILNNHTGENCRIVIVSDHGMSYLSRLTDSLKSDKQAEHEGRYLICDSMLQHDTDFVIHTNETDGKTYKVALKHASLGNKPTHEVHGGCTPEEVVVPFIVLAPTSSVSQYSIKLKTNRIPLSKPKVELFISPKPLSMNLIFGNTSIAMQHKSADLWTALLPNPVEGRQSIQIHPSGGIIQSIDIDIYGMGFDGNINDVFNI